MQKILVNRIKCRKCGYLEDIEELSEYEEE